MNQTDNHNDDQTNYLNLLKRLIKKVKVKGTLIKHCSEKEGLNGGSWQILIRLKHYSLHENEHQRLHCEQNPGEKRKIDEFENILTHEQTQNQHERNLGNVCVTGDRHFSQRPNSSIQN